MLLDLLFSLTSASFHDPREQKSVIVWRADALTGAPLAVPRTFVLLRFRRDAEGGGRVGPSWHYLFERHEARSKRIWILSLRLKTARCDAYGNTNYLVSMGHTQ